MSTPKPSRREFLFAGTLAARDESLRRLFRGLIRRQARCIQLDPYANAFYSGPELGEWRNDETETKPALLASL